MFALSGQCLLGKKELPVPKSAWDSVVSSSAVV